MNVNDLSDDDLALLIYMDSGLDESQDYADACNEVARRRREEYTCTINSANEARPSVTCDVDVKAWASARINDRQERSPSLHRFKALLPFALMHVNMIDMFAEMEAALPEDRQSAKLAKVLAREIEMKFTKLMSDPAEPETVANLNKTKIDRDPQIKRERKTARNKAKRKRRKSGLR